MMSIFFRRFTIQAVFFTGLFLMVLGISFLFGFMYGTSRISVFFSFLLVVVGAFCALFSIKLKKRASYLFFASLFMMTGLFLFLSALGIVDLPVTRSWPLLSVFSGLALLPMCWRRHGTLRKKYIVSSLAFVILGSVFLIFSLQVVPFSFRRFMSDWWPVLFLFGGLTLVLLSLGSRKSE